MTINKMTDKKHVAKQYKTDKSLKIRKVFHKKYSLIKQNFGSWLFDQYEIPPNSEVLELGSGNGDFWQFNIDKLSKNAHFVLSDFSTGMVNILKEKYNNFDIEIEKIDIQTIPFKEESFDIVIANAMLYHVPNLSDAIKEVYRVLKPGGKFYTSTFGENGLPKFINDSLNEMSFGSSQITNSTFTLQNGASVLGEHFDKVKRIDYKDKLQVTESKDIVDYIYSMTSMRGINESDKKEMFEYFQQMKNEKGIIEIPKEYGTFISIKYK